jgi:hypothetical protein
MRATCSAKKVRVALDKNDDRMVRKRSCSAAATTVAPKTWGPFAEAPVVGRDHPEAFLAGVDEVQERIAAFRARGQVAVSSTMSRPWRESAHVRRACPDARRTASATLGEGHVDAPVGAHCLHAKRDRQNSNDCQVFIQGPASKGAACAVSVNIASANCITLGGPRQDLELERRQVSLNKSLRLLRASIQTAAVLHARLDDGLSPA